jgi:ketosteroid isomerase-like protein
MDGVVGRLDVAPSAGAVTTEFFDRFHAHDVEGMAALCSIGAGFSYVPVEIWGKQRVQRAEGTVQSMGKAFWHGLIAAFPDLAVNVRTMTANAEGDVVVQVEVSGTQERPWGRITPTGRHFAEPHLFILHVNEDQLIDDLTAYWNEAGIAQQLGHGEVD